MREGGDHETITTCIVGLCVFLTIETACANSADYCSLSARRMTIEEESQYWKTSSCVGIVAMPPAIVEAESKPCPNNLKVCCLATEPDRLGEDSLLYGVRGVYEPVCRRIVLPKRCPDAIAHETIHHLFEMEGFIEESETHQSRLFEICAPSIHQE